MARREAGALFFIVNDHLGTPKEVVSEAGRLAWCADHDALETPPAAIREGPEEAAE